MNTIASIGEWIYTWTYTYPLMSAALVAVLYTIYIMPMLIASERRHEHVTAIVLFNIFTGWTFLAGSSRSFGHWPKKTISRLVD